MTCNCPRVLQLSSAALLSVERCAPWHVVYNVMGLLLLLLVWLILGPVQVAEGGGVRLPLEGSIPDMHATTEWVAPLTALLVKDCFRWQLLDGTVIRPFNCVTSPTS